MDNTAEQQNALTMEALDQDWWHAIYRPLPDAPTGELVEKAHFAAQYCFQGARSRAEDLQSRALRASEPQLSAYAAKGDASQHAEAALERLLELERRWPHQLERLTGQPHIPESVEALREELQLSAENRKNEAHTDELANDKQADAPSRTKQSGTGAEPADRARDRDDDFERADDMGFSRDWDGRDR